MQAVEGQRRPELGALTGARFLAAMAVLVFHYGREFLILAPTAAKNVQKIGYIAVPFFFLLSGFILAYNYADRPTPKTKFWRARVARVYPAYIIGLALGLPLFWPAIAQAGLLTQFKEIAIRALMVQSWIPSTIGAWNFAAWSLSAEAFFYLMFPLLLPVMARVPRKWLLPAAVGCVVLALVPPVVWLGWLKPDGMVTAVTNTNLHTAILKCNPLLRLPDFMAGMFLGLAFVRGLDRWLTDRPSVVFGMLTAGTVCISLAVAYRREVPWELFHNGLLLIPFGLWVLGLAVSQGPVASLLAKPPMRFLGEVSYAIYIIHMPVHELMKRYMGVMAMDAKLFFPLYVLAVMVLSTITYLWIERPGRGWIAGRSRSRLAASAAAG